MESAPRRRGASPGSETLREVPRETFERARAESHLNPTSRRRAEHFFSESSRVDEGERACEGNRPDSGAADARVGRIIRGELRVRVRTDV